MGWTVSRGTHYSSWLLIPVAFIRTTHVITDVAQYIMITLVGFPKDNPSSRSKPWGGVASGAASIIDTTRTQQGISPRRHRRGNFAALACGVSYGGGQEVSGLFPAFMYSV